MKASQLALAAEFVAQFPGAVVVDQAGPDGSSRSTPASHLGIMDAIRNQFAEATGVDAGFLSFNSKGACPRCAGKGQITADMAFMDRSPPCASFVRATGSTPRC